MAKTPSAYGSHAADYNKDKPKKERFNGVQFIQFELDKELQQTCKGWSVDEAGIFDTLLKLADMGYSISVKYDDFSSSYAAFMRQTNQKGANYGFILSGRGSSPFKAIKQMLFKHYHVMDTDWKDFAQRKPADEIDD